MADIRSRKADHLDLTARGDVAFKRTSTLFECVRLIHDALPELAVSDVDLACHAVGKVLKAPILIAAMTGGNERSRAINRDLASIAEEKGYAFGLGSQRAMHRDGALADTYSVREVAPTAVVLGNIGGVQAREMGVDAVRNLVDAVRADALCVHLNPAMEVIQVDGDRDFRGVVDTIGDLVRRLEVPVVAKETGCGLSLDTGRRLRDVGVRHVDVSGAGGTSWVAVETQRAEGQGRRLGESFWEWGIPTAASVAWMAETGFSTVFATGGVKSGLDIAKAIALGASAGGIARPVLQAWDTGGREGALEFLESVERELRTALLLVGARNTEALASSRPIITGELREWMAASRTP